MGTFNVEIINESIRGTEFISDRKEYLILKLNRSDFKKLMELSRGFDESIGYFEIILDKDELSFAIEKEIWEKEFKETFSEVDYLGPLACITCDVSKGIGTVTGYLLAVNSVLSPNNVGIYVQGAYTTDHIFVDYENLDKAIDLLNELKERGFQY